MRVRWSWPAGAGGTRAYARACACWHSYKCMQNTRKANTRTVLVYVATQFNRALFSLAGT